MNEKEMNLAILKELRKIAGKVFPAESFQSRRKINRFKPRHFVGRTNHHIYEENSLERKRNGNTSVYRILIRCETEICNW